jgi:hypothetical protein
MVALGLLYLGISTALAAIVAIGVAVAPRADRAELAAWGVGAVLLWPLVLGGLFLDTVAATLALVFTRFSGWLNDR